MRTGIRRTPPLRASRLEHVGNLVAVRCLTQIASVGELKSISPLPALEMLSEFPRTPKIVAPTSHPLSHEPSRQAMCFSFGTK